MSKRNWLLLPALSCCALLVSCATAPTYRGMETSLTRYPYADRSCRPSIWVTYYPGFSPLTTNGGTAALSERPCKLSEVRPERDHGGSWTDDVMRYDLDSMQASNIHAALLMLRPQDLIDEAKLTRIRRFFTLASTCRPRFKVGLGIYSTSKLVMGTGNFCRFLHQSNFHELKGALSLPSSPNRLLVVFDSRNITLNQQHFPEENLFEVRQFSSLKPSEVALIHGGDCGLSHGIDWASQEEWSLPRGDGTYLMENLKRAFLGRSPIICLHSWNNLQDGSFLVPNNFDQNLLLDTLGQALDNLEELRLK